MKRTLLTLIAVLMLANAAFAADATSVADRDLQKQSVAVTDAAATPQPTSVATRIDLSNVPAEFHWLAIFWYMKINGTVL